MALVENKKARADYEILETYEAGMKLRGFEVKSLKKGQGSLKGAFVRVRGGEAWLVGAHIPPYQAANTPDDYDPYRSRKLLLNRKEIEQMAEFESQKGLTVVPLLVYNKGRNLKLSVGIARGLKKHDKREKIRSRDTKRDIERTLKNKY